MAWRIAAGICVAGWFALLLRSQRLWNTIPEKGPPPSQHLQARRWCHRAGFAVAIVGAVAATVSMVALNGWRAWAPWLLLAANLIGAAYLWLAIKLEGGS